MKLTDTLKQLFAKKDGTKDPVCGMAVDPTTSQYQSVYRGRKYAFCSEQCKNTFDKNPEGYVTG